MRLVRFYYKFAVGIAVLEITDGVLLLIDKGLMNWFNAIVSLIELSWLPICTIAAYIFMKNKISFISPLSFVLYFSTGSIIAAAVVAPGETGAPTTLPLWLGIVGAAFGIYYLLINDYMNRRLSQNPPS